MDTIARGIPGRLIAVVVVICLLSMGCTSSVSGRAMRDPAAAPANVPPLDEAQLDGLMLSIDELASIVGASELESLSELDEMSDNSTAVSDPDCLGAIFGAEQAVYDGSDWTAVRDLVAGDPSEDRQHWVEQTAVLYPSDQQARQFFDDSTSDWGDCADFSVSVDDFDAAYIWQVEDLNVRGDVIVQVTTQEDSGGWQCQHALSAVSNLTVETWSCAFELNDAAVEMAEAIVAKAAK